jgi:hypothetical protein
MRKTASMRNATDAARPCLLILLRKNSHLPPSATQNSVSGPHAEAGCMVCKRRNSAVIDGQTDTPLLGFSQFWIFEHEVESLSQCVDLIVERAMRKLLNLRLPRLAPLSIPRQLYSATLDYVDVVKKSRSLRAAIRWNETYFRRAESLPQITSQSWPIARIFD